MLVTIYLTTLIKLGFRPEPEAFGLLFVGLSLLGTTASFGQKCLSLIVIGCSILVYPIVLGLAIPFSVGVLWTQRPPETSARNWLLAIFRDWWLAGLIAVSIVMVAFLMMIHFDWESFLEVFAAHRRLRSPELKSIRHEYWRQLTYGYESLLTLPVNALLLVVVAVTTICWRQIESRARTLIYACAASAVFCILLYVNTAMRWVELSAFCAGITLAGASYFRRWRWLAFAMLTGVYILSQSPWILNVCFRRFLSSATLREVRESALHTGKILVVDASTARYVFDFRLPPGTKCENYNQPWGTFSMKSISSDDTLWIVSLPFFTWEHSNVPEEYNNFPRVYIGSRRFRTIPLEPDTPTMLPLP